MKLNTNIQLACLALSAFTLGSSPVFAANGPKSQEERGTIKSVDATAHTVVVTDLKNNSEHKFVWTDQTKFSERGKNVSAAELKAGERVRITYSGSGELLTMQRVRIAPAKTEKPAAAKS